MKMLLVLMLVGCGKKAPDPAPPPPDPTPAKGLFVEQSCHEPDEIYLSVIARREQAITIVATYYVEGESKRDSKAVEVPAGGAGTKDGITLTGLRYRTCYTIDLVVHEPDHLPSEPLTRKECTGEHECML